MNSEEKRMLMLKNTGSNFFDEAYFVLRDTAMKHKVSETQLIKEANRIVNESYISGYFNPGAKKQKKTGERVKFLLGGFAMGVFACLLFYLIFS